jgi:hypothetical protein
MSNVKNWKKTGTKNTNQNKQLQANGFTSIALSFRIFDCILFSFFHHVYALRTRITEPEISQFFTYQIAFAVGTFGQKKTAQFRDKDVKISPSQPSGAYGKEVQLLHILKLGNSWRQMVNFTA